MPWRADSILGLHGINEVHQIYPGGYILDVYPGGVRAKGGAIAGGRMKEAELIALRAVVVVYGRIFASLTKAHDWLVF